MGNPAEQRDNAAIAEKLRWRREALRLAGPTPVVCEAYVGWGEIGGELYQDVAAGVALEKRPEKAAFVAQQRPTWAVYEGDSLRMLRLGVGDHLPITYLDVDPYGEPWTTLQAWFESPRMHQPMLVVVAHDGTNRLVQMGKAWTVNVMQPAVTRFGNSHVKEHYDEASAFLLGHYAAAAGYLVASFRWSSGGERHKSAHFLAVLVQDTLELGDDMRVEESARLVA